MVKRLTKYIYDDTVYCVLFDIGSIGCAGAIAILQKLLKKTYIKYVLVL
jgi:hypothetical protein